jgi:site-specific recombinase XerD
VIEQMVPGSRDDGDWCASGALVELHMTHAAGAGAGVSGLGPGVVLDAALVLNRAGVREGQPFVLGSDGSYDLALNRFLRELDGWGVRAANSVAAYGRDVMLFCRFLHDSRGGKSIWECDGADLRAFKRVRLGTPGARQVSVATWRRSVAALDKWVAWAVYEGLLEQAPFRYLDKTVWTPQGMRQVRVNAESEPYPGPAPVRFIPFEDYLLWRDVGLRGRLPDGRPDPSWRGRHDERNALFADLLVYSGMRLGEAASLLVVELPSQMYAGRGQAGPILLGQAVTKRNRPRTVFVPPRLVRALHRYLRIERDELVARIAASGGYRAGEDAVLVRRASGMSVRFADGGATSPGKLDPSTRQRLRQVSDDGQVAGPLAVWLGTDGQPVRSSTWQSLFHRANLRCERFDLDLKVSPHTLRHSFAVHMLGLLLRQTVAALGHEPGQRYTSAQVKRLLVGNPLRRLQLLLGHASEATVYTYLDVLDEAQEIVAGALEQWDNQAAALALSAAGEADRADDGTGTDGDGTGAAGQRVVV